ncbi:MAG: TrkH family potassium uptake protein [Trueperaceae bacterium]|nr:TrkH family potassium uptake protein [Trueperaceae bacterium]
MPPTGTRGRFAPFVLGTGLLALAAAAGLFAAGAAVADEDARGFAATAGIALALGAPLRRVGRAGLEPTRREALLTVLALWLLAPVVGSIPYATSASMTPLNALFESMSGFTATGATAIVDFEAVPASVFLWCAFAQWVGGIGILVLFIAVFPQLAIAGRRVFHTEMPGPTQDRLTPRLRQTAGIVLGVYVALTVVCGVAYLLARMPLFDAVAHALTTVAAAGFSPSARSFEAYHPAVDWVAIVFMTLATQSTTGYASVDYDQWPDAARALLVALMAIGGSAGSAAGGVKVARWLIVAQHTGREVRRALHPRAVLPIRVGDRVIGEDVLRAVAAFITLYTALVVFGTLVLALTGEDLITAFTASAATVGNVGPGLGVVGPMASYAELHPLARALLIFNMYAGRLEIVTVFVIATPSWWRIPRTLRGGRRGAPDPGRAPAPAALGS